MFHYFGCSFTAGDGIRPGSRYGISKFHHTYRGYTWDRILAREIYKDKPFINYGYGGLSTQAIVYEVGKWLHYFKPGDIVIVGTSGDGRMPIWKQEPFSNQVRKDSLNPATIYSMLDELEKVKHRKIVKYVQGYSHSFCSALIDYYTTLHDEPAAREAEREELMEILLSYQKLCKQNDIKMLIWTWHLWGCFEDIDHWSNGSVPDGHWSPNGHIAFAHMLKHCLDNNKLVMDVEYIKSHRIKKRKTKKKHYKHIKWSNDQNLPYIEYDYSVPHSLKPIDHIQTPHPPVPKK